MYRRELARWARRVLERARRLARSYETAGNLEWARRIRTLARIDTRSVIAAYDSRKLQKINL